MPGSISLISIAKRRSPYVFRILGFLIVLYHSRKNPLLLKALIIRRRGDFLISYRELLSMLHSYHNIKGGEKFLFNRE